MCMEVVAEAIPVFIFTRQDEGGLEREHVVRLALPRWCPVILGIQR